MRRDLWVILLCLAIPIAALFWVSWEKSRWRCVETGPGTCWRTYVPLHSGPYPCTMCTKWERKS